MDSVEDDDDGGTLLVVDNRGGGRDGAVLVLGMPSLSSVLLSLLLWLPPVAVDPRPRRPRRDGSGPSPRPRVPSDILSS